ncbi:MAG: SDR family oxidoreductase [Armatimonadetes bacterium]|nr:SDR family oxidoreductase [Armatimonadota bacterium]
MKILVTGGAGFIGSHVVEAYLATGHAVAVVDTLATGRRENLPPGVRLHQVDLRDEALDGVFAEERPEVVNHHAAQASVAVSLRDPRGDAAVNVIGGLCLLELCVRHGVRRVIYASTGGAIYGDAASLPTDERHPAAPSSPYGVAKYALEQYLHAFRVMHGLPSVTLRYANVYGPRQDPHGEAGVIALFIHAMLRGEQPTVFGDGAQTRDFVGVEDVARANVLALQSDAAGVFNIGTGVETSVNDLFARLAALTGSPGRPARAPARPGEVYRSVLDVRLAAERLGWTPQVSLQEGLHRTVDWFRARL